MLRLNLARAPSWIDLAHGVRVEVEPVGSTIMAAASSDTFSPVVNDAPDPVTAEDLWEAFSGAIPEVRAEFQAFMADRPIEESSTEAVSAKPISTPNAGAQNVAFAKAIARRAILAWEGVMDDAGKPLPVSDEAVDALFEQSVDCLRAFREGYVNKGSELVAEGNGSAPSPSGTTGEAPDTAKPAPDDARPAPKSKTAPKA